MFRRIGQVIIGLVLFAAFFIAVFGTAVHLLWNGLMPQLFGLPHLGFWQGVGLLTLSWLLFGGRSSLRLCACWALPMEKY